jgi:hypothetical protein
VYDEGPGVNGMAQACGRFKFSTAWVVVVVAAGKLSRPPDAADERIAQEREQTVRPAPT